MSPRRALIALVALAALGTGAVACSSDSDATKVAVRGTNDACELETSSLPAGPLAFEFTNEADDVNELYVLQGDSDVKGEVENVTTGTSRTLRVNLPAGDYQVRCKPGQKGKGFSSEFTVTGGGGTEQAAADRTVTFEAEDFDYRDLDLSGIADGDTITFTMTNSADQPHEFEVLDPDGDPVGEIAAVDPGKTGSATITFDRPGKYSYQCILIDEATGKSHAMLGMEGTFTVSAA